MAYDAAPLVEQGGALHAIEVVMTERTVRGMSGWCEGFVVRRPNSLRVDGPPAQRFPLEVSSVLPSYGARPHKPTVRGSA